LGSSLAKFEFGPFAVDAAAGELSRNGMRVRLQDQPFRLLLVLLERAGEVVSREEIQRQIWPENTFGDFNSGLRVAMGKLREALGDDAEKPVYLETIPKRGYRFLGPVERVTTDAAANTIPLEVAHAVAQEPASVGPSQSRKKFALWTAAIGLILLAGSGVFFLRHRARPAAGVDSVVLAEFANATGDTAFDNTLRQGVEVQLGQSPTLTLISDDRIAHALQLMDQPPDARLTPQLARDICKRLRASAEVEGSIAMLGSRYVIGLRAYDCGDGRVVDEEQTQAERKEEVLDALDRLTNRMRRRLGESVANIQEHDTPLHEATTSSFEAFQAYSTGIRVVAAHGEVAALPFFQKAVDLDPQFASAYAYLGLMYGATGESDMAGQMTAKAFALRNRATENERFFIMVYYQGRTVGDQLEAARICEQWVRVYPKESLPHTFLSGFIYPTLGKYEGAVGEAKTAVANDPDLELGYLNLAANAMALNENAQAANALRQAKDRGLQSPFLLGMQHDLDFVRGDESAAASDVAAASSIPDTDDWIMQHQAFAAAFHGRLAEATGLANRASQLALHNSRTEQAALLQAPVALWEALFGQYAAARRDAGETLKLSRDREVKYAAALAYALAQDTGQAQALATDLEKSYPKDTSVQFNYLPTLHAAIALARHEPEAAILYLQAASPFELGTPRSTLQGLFGAMYPVYLRGLAYLGLHQGREAAVEFQKVLDHPGVTVTDPVGSLSQLQLARAYALEGDKPNAEAAYGKFLKLWASADRNLPVMEAFSLRLTSDDDAKRWKSIEGISPSPFHP
jgi:DNA-binding winged helix-turn-helix (wHTH) protein/Tfp pilus assembly protein PilF